MAEVKMRRLFPSNVLAHWRIFLKKDLWRQDHSRLAPWRRNVYQILQIFVLVAERFFSNKVLMRASALTYATVLSIVPLLAFLFSLLKGLGVQNRLEPILLARVSAGSQEMVGRLVDYIDRIHVGSLGVVGLAALVLSCFFVLSNVESAFNDIWGVPAPRSFRRKFADYLSVTLVTPVFLLLALSATAVLKSSWVVSWLKAQPGIGALVIVQLRFFPYMALWFSMTFLYMFMPNTRVRFKPALIAGVLTGTIWQLTQWGYITFQVGVGNFNAIYGTFAQLPFMLVWIYISWVVVLFGAEFSFAFQNHEVYRQERNSGELTGSVRAELALAFLRDIQGRFGAGAAPWTPEALAHRHGVPLRRTRLVLDELVRLGYLRPDQPGRDAGNPQAAYLPARGFGRLPVSGLLEQLESGAPAGTPEENETDGGVRRAERALLERGRRARRRALAGEMIGLPGPKKTIVTPQRRPRPRGGRRLSDG